MMKKILTITGIVVVLCCFVLLTKVIAADYQSYFDYSSLSMPTYQGFDTGFWFSNSLPSNYLYPGEGSSFYGYQSFANSEWIPGMVHGEKVLTHNTNFINTDMMDIWDNIYVPIIIIDYSDMLDFYDIIYPKHKPEYYPYPGPWPTPDPWLY